MTAKYENVHWENRDGIAIITIDRPKALNALNMATMKELHALFAEVAHDETVDVIILTGAGEKAFVAGADIKEMAAMDTLSGRDWGRFGQAVTQQLEDAPQPVIAEVNGYALGGGCELTLACDFRYASENAQFGQPEVKWGICAGFGASQRLTRAVGPAMAKELLYTADFIDAQEALRIGLVNRVVPQKDLLETALATAKRIQKNAKVAVRATKRSVLAGQDLDQRNAIELEAQYFGICFATEDQTKRMQSFGKKK